MTPHLTVAVTVHTDQDLEDMPVWTATATDPAGNPVAEGSGATIEIAHERLGEALTKRARTIRADAARNARP